MGELVGVEGREACRGNATTPTILLGRSPLPSTLRRRMPGVSNERERVCKEVQERGKGDAYRSARSCGPAASGRLSEEEEGSGRQWERIRKGGRPDARERERDSNSLHVRLRASSTRPDSPPWRVDEVAVRDSGAAVVLQQTFFLNSTSNPVQGIGGGRLSMLYHVGSTETRELVAAPCGTTSSWELPLRAPGRLCPRRTERGCSTRAWMRAGQTDTPGKSRWLQQASTRPS